MQSRAELAAEAEKQDDPLVVANEDEEWVEDDEGNVGFLNLVEDFYHTYERNPNTSC